MTTTQILLDQVNHVQTFLKAAEAALASDGPEPAKIGAVHAIREEMDQAWADFRKRLDEAHAKAPSFADFAEVNRERGERDRAASAAGKTAN